jgi:RsiW-degrading membrane proteinase PrsW (M82 family)
MNSKRIGAILLGALVMTVIIFIIDINFYNTDYTKSELNKTLMWSFIQGLVISLAVNIGTNYYRSLEKNKKN